MLIFKTVIQTTINPALQIPPQEAVLNNNEAGSNDDDKGHGEEVRKVTQQTGVTVGFGRQEMEKREGFTLP